MNLIRIEYYYVPDNKIIYRKVYSLRFRGIHQELSEVQHLDDNVCYYSKCRLLTPYLHNVISHSILNGFF